MRIYTYMSQRLWMKLSLSQLMFWKPQVKPLPGSYWNRFSRLSTSWILSIQRFLQIFTQQLLLWQIYSMENFGSPRKKDIIMNFFGCTFRWNLADQCVKHPSIFNALLVFFLSLNIWEISSVWILSYWTKASSVLLSAETFWALLEWWWEKGIRSAWSIKTLESYHLPPPGGWRVRFLFQSMTNFCLY